MRKILFVDDDTALLELLSFAVQRAGLSPIVAASGPTALRMATEHRPDLIVLDILLGEDDGFEVLQALRGVSDVPIIMLSSLDSEDHIERALELGADGYVTKPFPFRELIARIQAVLRRTSDPQRVEPGDPWTRSGTLALNLHEYRATLDGLPLAVTATEFRLLQLLMEYIGEVVPYSVLLKQVWGYDDPDAGSVVRAAVYRLRRKLVRTNGQVVIYTLPGVGVVLRSSAEKNGDGLLGDKRLFAQPFRG